VIAAPILGFGALIAIVLAQSRFHDAWFAQFGGPTRRQRLEMVVRDFPQYWSLISHPPYTLKALFTAVSHPVVERRRKQLLTSIAGFPAAFVLVVLLTTFDVQPAPFVPVLVALVFLGVLYGLILLPGPRREG